MRKRKLQQRLANFKATPTPQIVKFEAAPLSADFREADGLVQTSGLILVEGEHVDSKQRKHIFSADRVRKIVENTNKLLQQGARVPLLTDHQKTQDTTIGDVEGAIEARVITENDISDDRYKHLVGRFGAFATGISIKARKAIEQYKDRLISTISPGIDIVSDVIREVSCTSTPAIVGLRLFKSYDGEATFALSFEELEQDSGMIDQIKSKYDTLTEQLWVVLTSVLTADDEVLGEQNQSELLEKALDDFENRVLEALGVTPDEEDSEEAAEPQTYAEEDTAAQKQAGMPRTLSQRTPTAKYNSSPEVVAAFTLDEMEKLAQFGLRSSIFQGAKKVVTRLGKEKASIKHQGGLGKAVAGGLGRTKFATQSGFNTAKASAQAAGKGRLRSNLSGIKGATKGALSTRGGKIAAGAVGTTAAVGTGMALRPRKPKVPKI